MYRHMNKLLFTIMLMLPFITYAETADQLVYQADQYRQSSDNLKVTSLIKLYKDGQLDKERIYDVYIKPDRSEERRVGKECRL